MKPELGTAGGTDIVIPGTLVHPISTNCAGSVHHLSFTSFKEVAHIVWLWMASAGLLHNKPMSRRNRPAWNGSKKCPNDSIHVHHTECIRARVETHSVPEFPRAFVNMARSWIEPKRVGHVCVFDRVVRPQFSPLIGEVPLELQRTSESARIRHSPLEIS